MDVPKHPRVYLHLGMLAESDGWLDVPLREDTRKTRHSGSTFSFLIVYKVEVLHVTRKYILYQSNAVESPSHKLFNNHFTCPLG